PLGPGTWLDRFAKSGGLQPGRREMLVRRMGAAREEPETEAPGQEPLLVRGDVLPPQLLTKVQPSYPLNARAAGVEGKVIVEAIINTEGCVEGMRILRSIPQ